MKTKKAQDKKPLQNGGMRRLMASFRQKQPDSEQPKSVMLKISMEKLNALMPDVTGEEKMNYLRLCVMNAASGYFEKEHASPMLAYGIGPEQMFSQPGKGGTVSIIGSERSGLEIKLFGMPQDVEQRLRGLLKQFME